MIRPRVAWLCSWGRYDKSGVNLERLPHSQQATRQLLKIRWRHQMKAQRQPRESAHRPAQFVGGYLGAGQKHASGRDPEGEHSPIANYVPRQGARNLGTDVERL